MIKLVESLLQDHTRVILPEFGAILKNPDTGNLSFNQFLYFNDNFLAEALCQVEKIERNEANRRIEAYVRKIRSSLDKEKSYKMGSLGTFVKAEDGSITIVSEKGPTVSEAKETESKEGEKTQEENNAIEKEHEKETAEKPTEEQKNLSEAEPGGKLAASAEIELDEEEEVTEKPESEEPAVAESADTEGSMEDMVNIDLDAEEKEEEEEEEEEEANEDKTTSKEEYPFPESHLHTAPGPPEEPPPANNNRANLGWWIGGGLLAGLIAVVVILYFLKPESFEFIFNSQKKVIATEESAVDPEREELIPTGEPLSEEQEIPEESELMEESPETIDKEPAKIPAEEITTAPPLTKAVPEANPADYPKQDKYFIVAGVFQYKSLAEDYVNTLRQLDYGAEICAIRKGMYAVSFDKYDRLSEALKHLEEIRANVEPEAWVLHH